MSTFHQIFFILSSLVEILCLLQTTFEIQEIRCLNHLFLMELKCFTSHECLNNEFECEKNISDCTWFSTQVLQELNEYFDFGGIKQFNDFNIRIIFFFDLLE